MEMEEKRLVTSRCILCRRKNNAEIDFKKIKETCLPASQKTIKEVLAHLGKCIKRQVNLQDSSYVCNPCYEKLTKYDRIMLELISHQKELSCLLETTIKALDEESTDDEFKESKDISCSDDSDAFSEEVVSDSSEIPASFYYKCLVCDQRLKSKTSLRMHLKTHSEAKMCRICGVVRKDQDYLDLHMNIHEGKSEKECRYCGKHFSIRAHVIRHMYLHWDKKKFQCEKCGLQFSHSQQLYNHKLHHDAEENPLVCVECGQTFKSSRTYKHHLLKHREDRPMYRCEMCDKQFSEKYTLKVHLKAHIEPSLEQPEPKKKKRTQTEIFCIICNSVQSSNDNLVEHMTNVHDVVMP